MTSNKQDQFGRQYNGSEPLTQLISCLSLPRKHDLLKQVMFKSLEYLHLILIKYQQNAVFNY